MAQSLLNPAELAGNLETVQVTHVESPVLFYCRLLTDEERVAALQTNIARYVAAEKPAVPDLTAPSGPSKYILVYSIIRDRWCRGRVISYQRNSDARPINAKVCLIDFGSIEIVLWNEKYVRMSTPEIDAFNDGRGFCFPCALGNIKPFDDLKCAEQLQWGSYANFLIEKETKNRLFLLRLLSSAGNTRSRTTNNTTSNNIVICDLLPASDILANDQNNHQAPSISQTQFASLTSYLVRSNVARYMQHTDGAGGDQIQSDEESEKENLFVAAHNC